MLLENVSALLSTEENCRRLMHFIVQAMVLTCVVFNLTGPERLSHAKITELDSYFQASVKFVSFYFDSVLAPCRNFANERCRCTG